MKYLCMVLALLLVSCNTTQFQTQQLFDFLKNAKISIPTNVEPVKRESANNSNEDF